MKFIIPENCSCCSRRLVKTENEPRKFKGPSCIKVEFDPEQQVKQEEVPVEEHTKTCRGGMKIDLNFDGYSSKVGESLDSYIKSACGKFKNKFNNHKSFKMLRYRNFNPMNHYRKFPNFGTKFRKFGEYKGHFSYYNPAKNHLKNEQNVNGTRYDENSLNEKTPEPFSSGFNMIAKSGIKVNESLNIKLSTSALQDSSLSSKPIRLIRGGMDHGNVENTSKSNYPSEEEIQSNLKNMKKCFYLDNVSMISTENNEDPQFVKALCPSCRSDDDDKYLDTSDVEVLYDTTRSFKNHQETPLSVSVTDGFPSYLTTSKTIFSSTPAKPMNHGSFFF